MILEQKTQHPGMGEGWKAHSVESYDQAKEQAIVADQNGHPVIYTEGPHGKYLHIKGA